MTHEKNDMILFSIPKNEWKLIEPDSVYMQAQNKVVASPTPQQKIPRQSNSILKTNFISPAFQSPQFKKQEGNKVISQRLEAYLKQRKENANKSSSIFENTVLNYSMLKNDKNMNSEVKNQRKLAVLTKNLELLSEIELSFG